MPRQFISICGHSAVGKKTLIQKLLANDPPCLREQFHVTGSVGGYGLCAGMEQPYLMLQAGEQTILHFWQDNTHPWVAYLREQFPDDRHRVILLWRSWEEHSATLIARGTPGYRPSPDELRKNWNDMRVPQFRALEAKGFKIELFRVIQGEPYEPLTDWPA